MIIKHELILYPRAFRDIDDIDTTRYLFENSDITLYVWISDDLRLTSFQVNCKEEFFIHFNKPDKLKILKKTDNPILRSLNENFTKQEELAAKEKMAGIGNNDFPELFSKIRNIINYNREEDFKIVSIEAQRLKKIEVDDYMKGNASNN